MSTRIEIKSAGSGSAGSGVAFLEPNLQSYHNSISYSDYDDAWRDANGLFKHPFFNAEFQQQLDVSSVDPFNTLLYNNSFGNKIRFTNLAGAAASGYTNFIDHLTGREYIYVGAGFANWVLALTFYYEAPYDGWMLPSQAELNSLKNMNSPHIAINGSIWQASTQQGWSGTTDIANTANAICYDNNSYPTLSVPKINTRRATFRLKLWTP